METPSQQSASEWFEALGPFPEHVPPLSLIHFTSRDCAQKILSRGELKVTPPSELNDPFEFNPGIPGDTPTPHEISEFLADQIGFGPVFVEELRAELGADTDLQEFCLNNPKRVHRFLLEKHQQIRTRISECFGVVCFTAIDPLKEESIRQWAIYGDKHAGVAIEFSGTSEFMRLWAKAKLLYPVDYPPQPRIKLVLADLIGLRDHAWWPLFRRWGGTKSQFWAPEREWRLFKPLGAYPEFPSREISENGKVHRLWQIWNSPAEAASMIRRVVLGCRFDKEMEGELRSVCRDLGLTDEQVVHARAHHSDFCFSPS
ncbi:MAG TPA: DUF2971 domain-containing protein [Opitutaceae bacterium]|nr:DUF2971 domain-containing protein [Opitutaceae bacterium]